MKSCRIPSLVYVFFSTLLIINILFSGSVYAEDIVAQYNFLGDQQQGKSGFVIAGQNSGAAGYTYDLEIPSGRNGLDPKLNLRYGSLSNNNDNVFGYGWDLPIGYVVRDAKEGVNNLYNKNYFSINIYGDTKELVPVSLSDGTHGAYGAMIEEYWKYVFNADNSWMIYDKKGTKYTFGSSVTTRQDDPGDATQIYKWMLEEVRDTNDNYIKFEYYKDQGQIYPKRIIYTGHGSVDGPIAITFEPFFTGPTTERVDKFSDYKAKFKITTRYIVDRINISVAGEQGGNSVIEYDLNFTTGGNGARSILQSVQRYGRNSSGVLESLPSTTFGYTTKANTWTDSSSTWPMPESFIYNQSDMGVRLVDVNGDGLVDVVRSGYDGQELKKVYLNTGNGWGSNNEAWANSLPNYRLSSQDVRMADINGDNLVDIVISKSNDTRQVYINNGSGWSLDSNWYVPDRLIDIDGRGNVYNAGVRLIDVNGDGLVDFVRSSNYLNNIDGIWIVTKKVYMNNGSGWNSTIDNNYANSLSVFFFDSSHTDIGNKVTDLNNDGLVDIVSGYNTIGYPKVYINTGVNWVEDANWMQPGIFYFSVGESDNGYRLFDVNGDSLVDIVRLYFDQNGYHKAVYLNKGSGFESVSNSYWANALPETPYNFTSYGATRLETGLSDVNGDGLDDFVFSTASQKVTYLANSYSADLLNSVTESEGKTIGYTYKPSTQYKDGSNNLENPSLPFVIHTLQQIMENDGLGNQHTTTYKYAGGDNYYSSSDLWNRRFTGFNLVQKTDPLGNIAKDYYHQNGGVDGSSQGEYQDHFSKIGRSYRSEIHNSGSQKYYQVINKWDRSDLGNNRNFVNLAQTVEFSYDGQSSHKDKARTFSYDSYGNISSEVNYGEVTGSDNGTFTDTGSDKITTNTSSIANTTNYVVGLPYQITKLDNGNSQIWQQKIYYDNLSLGSVDKGNQTKEERWLNPGNTYVNTQNAHNSHGNITSRTDENGRATTIAYDSNYFYPSSITNAKNQTSSVSYSLIFGKVLSETDPNNFQKQYTYDPFGRPLQIKIPDLTTPSTLRVQTENIYTDSVTPRKIETKKYLDTTNFVDSYTYLDGFKRKIQTRDQSETSSQFNVKDFSYNGRGEIAKEYLPYFATGSSYQSANTSNPANNYAYDALGRVVQIQNSVGTTTNAYLPWEVDTTDAKGKVKKAYKDAFDRLIKVDEIDGSSTYTTQYAFDQLGSLTKITDASGNIRNFTSDSLGRRTQAEDLHASVDNIFGVWNYGYDSKGSLTSKTDAKGQTTNYAYDELDRILTEDYTGQTGTEVSYTYDTATNGVGYLASVANADVITAYGYNSHNKVKSETRTINSIGYTTQFEYDLQDNQTKITYPDNAEIIYEYNTAGQLERILKKELGESNPASVIGNYNYASNNQPSQIDYANNASTQNTYDTSQLYRLINKATYKNTGGQGGFDPLLNVPDPNAIATYRIAELESERTANSKHYLNSDNSITAEFHIGNIHYEDANDVWQDIDLDMVDDGTEYKNKAHKFESRVPKKAQQPRKIGKAGQFISYRPIDANNVDAVLEQEGDKFNTARYTDAWQSADLIYKNRWYGLKEEIVLKDGTAPTQFSFELHPTNVNVEFADNQIMYRDKNGNLLWQTEKPFAIDAEGVRRDVVISLRPHGANYFIDLNLDATGLTYPITIDPTDTFYPNAHPEVVTVDGEVRRANVSDTWANKRTGEGLSSTDDASQAGAGSGVSLRSSWSTWWAMSRSIFLFDTSSLHSGTIVTSATFSLYRDGVNYNDFNLNVDIVSSNPASNTSLANSDYDYTKFGTTAYASINMSSFADGYNDFILNPDGINNINVVGISKFGARNSADRSNAEPGMIANSKSEIYYYYAERSGTSQDPKLTVTYHLSNQPPTAPNLLRTEALSSPSNVTNPNPNFDAIYNDPDVGDYAKWYQTQVIEEGGSFSSPKWDSGKIELNPTLLQGQRSSQISYSGLPLVLDGKKYFWRMKYWDDEGVTGAEGAWSDGTDYFVMKDNRSKYQDINYTYDAVGNITQIVNLAGSNTYGTYDYAYDNLHRLSSVAVTNSPVGNYSQTYTYDSIGNITNKSDIGSYTYSQTSKTNPHAVTSVGPINYTYDFNGNITSDGTHTYTWGYNNRLTSSTAGDVTYNYSYDHEGNRVKKVQGSNTTIYVNRYYEIDPSGKITKHIYGVDDRIALVETLSGVKTPYYVHKDHLGGSSVITDSSGNKVELADYYPYGSTRLDEKAGSFESKYKFTGKELDGETGLYYYGQRYYDPAIGRFASEDPAFLAVGDNDELKDITKLDLAKYLANPQLANSYSYTANNPLKFVDKEGEFLDTVIDAGFIVSDIRGIYQDIKNGNNPTIGAVALGFDVVGAFTPGITGLGAGAKALMGVEKAGDATKAVEGIKTIPNQVHHVATNKNTKFTQQFEQITQKYGLELNGDWNKVSMPHQGRHANEYHKHILTEIKRIDGAAKGSQQTFLKMFEGVKNEVKSNPGILRKK